jgi:hypothetical protein
MLQAIKIIKYLVYINMFFICIYLSLTLLKNLADINYFSTKSFNIWANSMILLCTQIMKVLITLIAIFISCLDLNKLIKIINKEIN